MKRRTFLTRAPVAATAAAAATLQVATTADDSLVNMERFRSSLRRLFQNDDGQVFGELIQNSQRAGAKHVSITTYENTFTYRDDGHGIIGGIDGFATMLRLADSYFENRTLEDQDPMGLGLHALLAHEDVESVVFESGGLGTTVDCRRWWDDPGYYGSWRARVRPSGIAKGFSVTVRMRAPEEHDNSLTERLMALFNGDRGPQAGYGDYLAITLNGQALDMSPPRDHRIEKPFLVTEYQGNRLLLEHTEDCYGYLSYNYPYINWYGQEIQGPKIGIRYRLEVRTGRPFNPRSPCREGIIEDDAWEKFREFVVNEVFKYVCDSPNRLKITPTHVAALHRLDAPRAVRECPYYTVRDISGWDLGDSSTICHDSLESARVVAYTDPVQPVLVAEEIEVHWDGKESRTLEHGRGVFLQELGDPDVQYADLGCGDKGRLKVLDIHWWPGEEHDVKVKYCSTDFRARGEWALVVGDAAPIWEPVTADVLAYDSGSSDVTSAEGVIGCAEVVKWLRSEQVDLLFEYNEDDANYDGQQEEFDQSVTDFICQLLGNTLPDNIALDQLIRKLEEKGKFSSITFGGTHLIVRYQDRHRERWELI